MLEKFTLKINNKTNDVSSDSLEELDAINVIDNHWHVIQKRKSFKAEVLEANFYGKTYQIVINGNRYQVDIQNQLDRQINQMGFAKSGGKKMNRITAPMPGIILKINVKEGDQIKEGDTLCVLEAMKMENAIASPKDGHIKSVLITEGATVEKSKLLIELA